MTEESFNLIRPVRSHVGKLHGLRVICSKNYGKCLYAKSKTSNGIRRYSLIGSHSYIGIYLGNTD